MHVGSIATPKGYVFVVLAKISPVVEQFFSFDLLATSRWEELLRFSGASIEYIKSVLFGRILLGEVTILLMYSCQILLKGK